MYSGMMYDSTVDRIVETIEQRMNFYDHRRIALYLNPLKEINIMPGTHCHRHFICKIFLLIYRFHS